MEFSQLQQRAVEIRKQYDDLNKKDNHHPWTPLTRMEGFVGDVGDLMKIVMAKEGYRSMENIDIKLKHELSDCLWCLLVLADNYGIDLKQEFLNTMHELEQRIKKDL